MTTNNDVLTSIDDLGKAIDGLRARHDRALDTLNTMRVLLLCPMDAVLKVSSLRAALDLYDRPMEQPEPEDVLRCESCDTPITRDDLRYEEGGGRSEPNWTDTGCRFCLKGRNVKPVSHDGAQSQAERDGDA